MPVRVLLVGCGVISAFHLSAMQKSGHFIVTAVADIDQGLAQKMADKVMAAARQSVGQHKRQRTSVGCKIFSSLQEALAASRETLGDTHPDTLVSIWNLSRLLSSKGDDEAAKRLCQEALSAARRVLGDDHPYTKVFIDNEWGIH